MQTALARTTAYVGSRCLGDTNGMRPKTKPIPFSHCLKTGKRNHGGLAIRSIRRARSDGSILHFNVTIAGASRFGPSCGIHHTKQLTAVRYESSFIRRQLPLQAVLILLAKRLAIDARRKTRFQARILGGNGRCSNGGGVVSIPPHPSIKAQSSPSRLGREWYLISTSR